MNLDRPALISVILPTLDEEKELPETWRSIISQRGFSSNLSIVVSDNGSTDGTLAICRQLRVSVVSGSTKGNIGSARAIGCREAMRIARRLGVAPQDHLLSFVDADTRMLEGYLACLEESFADPLVSAVSGPVTWNFANGRLTDGYWFHRLHLLSLLFRLRLSWLLPKIIRGEIFLPTCNAVLRESIYLAAGIEELLLTKARGVSVALTVALLSRGWPTTYLQGLAVVTSPRKFIDAQGSLSLSRVVGYFWQDREARKLSFASLRENYGEVRDQGFSLSDSNSGSF